MHWDSTRVSRCMVLLIHFMVQYSTSESLFFKIFFRFLGSSWFIKNYTQIESNRINNLPTLLSFAKKSF